MAVWAFVRSLYAVATRARACGARPVESLQARVSMLLLVFVCLGGALGCLVCVLVVLVLVARVLVVLVLVVLVLVVTGVKQSQLLVPD